MFKRFHAALAALILLASNPAFAADNYQVKDATGATLTLRSRDTGNGQSPQFVVGDPAGAAFLTSANPGYFTLSGVVPLPTGAATSAKQATPGVAGTPSADVLSVQGVAGGTPQNVDTVVRATSTSRSIIIPVAGVSATVSAGGSGHAVNDILTVSGGTCTVQPRYNVATVSSGAVATVTLNTAGSCTVLPSAPSATTSSGAGTAATLAQTYASISTQVMAANTARRGFQAQPQGNVAYVSGLGMATADYNSLKISTDALYETLPQHIGTGAVTAICGCAVPLGLYAREF